MRVFVPILALVACQGPILSASDARPEDTGAHGDAGRRSSEARDHGMADVFDMLRTALAPGRRVVNFAHNAHNRRRAESIVSASTFKSYGSWLGERLGDDYAPIGVFAAKVGWNWPSDIGAGEWITTRADAIETALRDLGRSNVWVDLRVAGGLFEPGRRYLSGQDADSSPPAENYRGLFFMQESEPWDGRFLLP